jgi:hypothetical protein
MKRKDKMKYFMQKYVTIKPDLFHGEGHNVLVSGNGSQWTVIFTGTLSACKRIVKAFTREGSQYTEQEVRHWDQ